MKKEQDAFWGYAFVGVALLTFVVFVARIIILQNTNVEEYKDNIINKNYREATLKAAREIFSPRMVLFWRQQ